MIQVLEGDNAIAKNRDLMGATDPKKAAAGTIRADFAQSIDANAVHGSDGADTARTEIAYLLPRARGLQPLIARSPAPLPRRDDPLLGLDAAGLDRFFAELGEKPFRARQVSRWLHQRFADARNA